MEKAILVGVKLKKEPIPLNESLEELEQLLKTAGARAVLTVTQAKDSPDLKYFIGSGKVEELKLFCEREKADLVVFDHSISSSQLRNLENLLQVKVVDRTELILDIFARHAHSHEGKLQVEMAQSSFLLSRLTGRGVMLSRLGGGIGTRGPGETKLEVDRRRIKNRLSALKKELESIREKRHLLREKRKSNQMKTAAIIGYTNAGKSTLLNALTNAGVLSEDKLFATLDPVTRRLYLPAEEKTILLTDTVGFIQKLPHQLVNAFRSTLEETIEADLLIHVIDASSVYVEHQIKAVYQTLEELKAGQIPILNVFNKIDKTGTVRSIHELTLRHPPSVSISALNREGLDGLVIKIGEMI